MHIWVIVLLVIAAAVIADVIYLVRKKKSGKCSCGHECGCCKGCSDHKK